MASALAWRCLVCGYVHTGAAPPEECPVCGAGRGDFEPYEATPAEAAEAEGGPSSGFSGKLAIVGGGIAGVTAAEAAREAAPAADIAIWSEEVEPPYHRLALTRLIAGEIEETDLPLHPPAWYEERRLRLQCGRRVATLDPAARRLRLEDGERHEYDRLILAPGARPNVPAISGVELEGVGTLRTRADAARLIAEAERGARFVFVGGGILALEAAAALRRRGGETILLERASRLLPRQLNERGARVLERHAAAAGIHVVSGARVSAIRGARRAEEVRLEDGRVFPADVIVISAGVRPATDLAESGGLHVERGVIVDDRLAASAPDVYAAGDAAEHRGVLYGTWEPARFQGRIAGWNAVGRPAEFGGMPRSNTLKVMGVQLFSVGETEGREEQVVEEETERGYFAFFFRGVELVGAILLGDTSAATGVRRAIEFREDVGAWLAKGAGAAELAAHLGATA